MMDARSRLPVDAFALALGKAVGSGIATIDTEGRQTYVNEAFCRMVGWPREALVGRSPPFDYWPEEEIEGLGGLLAQARSGTLPDAGAEAIFRRRNGTRFPVLLFVVPLRVDDRIEGWVANVVDLTIQRAQQEALRTSERLFRDLAEHIQEVFYVFDPVASRMTYISPLYERVWGRSCASLLAEPLSFLEAIAPEHRPRMTQALAENAAGLVTRDEYRIVRPDGSVAWIRDQGFPLRDERGVVSRVVGIAADITDRKRSEERLALALASARLCVWEWSARTGAVIFDARCALRIAQLLGDIEPTLEGWKARVHPDDLGLLVDGLRRWLAGDGLEHDAEYRVRNASGAYTWLASSARIVERDAQGRPLTIIGTHLDIDQRRRAAVDALSREEVLGITQEAAEIGYAVLYADTRTGYWSSKVYGILGYAPGSTPASFAALQARVHPDDRAKLTPLDALLDAAFASDARAKGDVAGVQRLRIVRQDGSLRHVVTWERVRRDERGNVVAAIRAVQDVTAAHAVEESRRQGERMEAIGALTSGLGHDFNNILGIVIAHLERVAGCRNVDTGVRSHIESALQAALRGADLTRSLLTVARRQPLERRLAEVNARLVGMLPLLRNAAGVKATLSLHRAAAPLVAYINTGQFDSALVNLVLNARDAMPAGGEIAITSRSEAIVDPGPAADLGIAPGRYVVVEVRDTGMGMGPDALRHAFDPYFTTKPAGRGTGLGLPMVQAYCQMMGGAATIASERDHGTTVRLYLPLSDTAPADVATPPPAGSYAPPLSGRILVVEDEPALEELACTVLRQEGHEVTGVPSAEEAIARLAGRGFDLVFSDVVLAGAMSGVDLARWVRAHSPGTAVVLASGVPMELADEAAADVFLEKPYRIAEMAAAMGALLAAREAARTTGTGVADPG